MSVEPTTVTWGDSSSSGPHALQVLLLEGKLTHRWTLPYGDGADGKAIEVVYDVFPMGVRADIAERVSGLDQNAQRIMQELFTVAHALRTVGGWDFKNGSTDEKLKFLRGLMDPMYALFVEQYHSARLKQIEDFDKRRELLGKSTPDRS